ncbi:CDP-alcohol phosphatidyltransferase family protein, partial [Nocardioides sp. CER28]
IATEEQQPAGLLDRLRGKDVLLVFVESYGRVAVQGTSYSPGVDTVLDRGTSQLRDAGYGARSAFLTSPTFGAASWLAHSTMQSGLWVDSQQRYDQLLTSRRDTLTSSFEQAGWRTVFDVPAVTKDWADGRRFYGFDKLYDAHDVGYRGPRFSYATMPDQFTLAALQRNELTPGSRRPVMAEIDLVSSHHPWAPLPRLVPWASVGDGSVFDGMPAQGDSPDQVFRDPDKVRAAYGQSIEYSWQSLVSWLTRHPDPNLVLVVLGDHQPHSYVTGSRPGHDVPVSVIAQDPRVLASIDDWHWQDGLHPSPEAPVWRMDAFRDRFLAAYSGDPIERREP